MLLHIYQFDGLVTIVNFESYSRILISCWALFNDKFIVSNVFLIYYIFCV